MSSHQNTKLSFSYLEEGLLQLFRLPLHSAPKPLWSSTLPQSLCGPAPPLWAKAAVLTGKITWGMEPAGVRSSPEVNGLITGSWGVVLL